VEGRVVRIRSTKPEFWQDEKMARELSRDARLLYKALWSESDDDGRLRGNIAYLHGTLFPYDPGSWFVDALDQLIRTGRAVAYEADGGSYLFLPKMLKHQKIDKPTPSKLPPPPDSAPSCSREPRENLATVSPLPRAVAGSGERVAGSEERVASRGEQGLLKPDKPVALPAEKEPEPDQGEQVAKKRTAEKKAKDDYISKLLPVMEGCYSGLHGMVLSAADGTRRKVLGHLVAIAKKDGYKTAAANMAEVERVLSAYFSDPDPFVAESKHPITQLLSSRLDRYRRPLVRPQERTNA
jgi:hypothetical protein